MSITSQQYENVSRNGNGQATVYVGSDTGLDQPDSSNSPFASVDLYGAIVRRKFIVILFALVGTGIGYLIYTKTPPVYASSLRLMIWVQNPPNVVNADYMSQASSISKHQGLIASELVMASAVEDGQLAKLPTFQGSSFPMGTLRGMISVSAAPDAADALDLRCTGLIAEDLPIALEKVVEAYTEIIEEDSASAGKDSIRLIEALQQRLVNDQKTAQTRYQELLKKLNLTAENDRGRWVNPYVEELTALKRERDASQKALEQAEWQINQVKNALNDKVNREELLQLIQLEARRYLQVNAESINEIDPDVAESLNLASRKKARIEAMEGELIALNADRLRLLKSVGPQHSSVLAIDNSIESIATQVQRIKEDVARLNSELNAKDVFESEQNAKDGTATKEDEKGPIRLYATALLRDRDRSVEALKKLSERITALENDATIIASDMIELNVLKEQIEERRNSVNQILDKLSAVNILANNYTTTKVRVINKPGKGYPIAPNFYQYLTIGTFAAALVGVALAILIDHSDLTYRTPIHIQEKLKAPVLCRIPSIKRVKPDPNFPGSPMLVVHTKPNSVAAEAFRSARTSMFFASNRIHGKVFLFTSPSPGDGKSTMTCNLAVSFAEAGKKVILVDADFRRPRVHTYFGLDIKHGVTDMLKDPSVDAIKPTFQENLSILTTGGRPKNPGELVSSNSFADLIGKLRDEYDFVLIDSPPLLPVADATAISRLVDGVLLVLRIRRGVAIASRKAKDQLDMVHAKVLGVIVNGVDQNPYYNEYGYYTGYGTGYAGNYGRYYDAQNVVYADRTVKGEIDHDK